MVQLYTATEKSGSKVYKKYEARGNSGGRVTFFYYYFPERGDYRQMEIDYASSYSKRRSYERYKLNDSATLILDKKVEKSLLLRDLSARGVGFICDFPLKANEKLEIIIKSSLFKNSMHKEANVVWCNKIEGNLYSVGLDFGIDNKVDFNN